MIFSLKGISSKILVLALVVFISACASKKNAGQDEQAATDAGATTSSVSTSGSDDGSVQTLSSGSSKGLENLSAAEIQQLLKSTSYYFDFDRFNVASSDERVILAHGQFLAKNSSARVRVEGHTDERGTREYNIALGERRGKSVQQILLSAGAQKKQIEVISYGEEQPKAQGQTEEAYAQNRRVDLKYTAGQP